MNGRIEAVFMLPALAGGLGRRKLRKAAPISWSVICIAVLLACMPSRAVAQTRVANSVHNLAAGTGKMRGDASVGICVFCHTPHNARPTRALWNRKLPGTSYKLYESSTLQAQLSQPTGSSRLCLSCHDGILALSDMRVTSGIRRVELVPPLAGRPSLGVDLSDDHPISFVYDSILSLRKRDLVDPIVLPRTAPLDDNKEMQCSSCHDPHEDRRPNFLRMDDRFGADCTVCHRQRDWRGSSHATSGDMWHAAGQKPWPNDGYPTMAENACLSCHRVHAAPHPARLLAQNQEDKNCTICHDGSMVRKNIAQEFLKPSHHPLEARQWTHDPAENPLTMVRHVTCVDCHNPHAATASRGASVLSLPGELRGVSGVTIGGAQTREANFEYEVCLKCHGTSEPTSPGIVRAEVTRNIRLKINPNNLSFHPVAAPGRNPRMLGLVAPYNTSSTITCTDCHNSDAWTRGGASPRGPHGSRFEPILAAEYQTVDPSPESYASYALCYKCHDRADILFGNSQSRFPHRKHVVDDRTSCAVCHDAHGSAQNLHTINFMIMSNQRVPVVRPTKSGRLEYVPDPAKPGHGKCYLKCHNTEHNPASY